MKQQLKRGNFKNFIEHTQLVAKGSIITFFPIFAFG
jgi:hypothetical protein